jgi:hypothetical protein
VATVIDDIGERGAGISRQSARARAGATKVATSASSNAAPVRKALTGALCVVDRIGNQYQSSR